MIKVKSILIVLVQFIAVIILILTGRIIPQNIFLLFLMVTGGIIGVLAVIEMKFKFNVFPQLLRSSKLITSGIYRLIRHPMYTSVLLITLAWVLDNINLLRFIVWLMLLSVLLFKIKLEEEILSKEFDDYKDYRSKTKKLIPFII
jgi:protein-S-isoprenylcysteine O-methyltransferase Ste14